MNAYEMPPRSVNYRRLGTNTMEVSMQAHLTPVERFWAKVNKTETCWLWTGFIGMGGYGRCYMNGRHTAAHRAAYELSIGPIPVGLQLDHLCRVRACVNPGHLEPVTPQENTRRSEAHAYWLARTHCSKGHEFTPENTSLGRKGSPRKRVCLQCRRERERGKKRVRSGRDAAYWRAYREMRKARAQELEVTD